MQCRGLQQRPGMQCSTSAADQACLEICGDDGVEGAAKRARHARAMQLLSQAAAHAQRQALLRVPKGHAHLVQGPQARRQTVLILFPVRRHNCLVLQIS